MKYGIGAFILAVAIVVVWLAIRTFQTRQIHTLNARFTDKTSAALQEAKLHDEEHGTSTFDALRPFLEKWDRTEDGLPDIQLQQHIQKALKKHHLTKPIGRRTGNGSTTARAAEVKM